MGRSLELQTGRSLEARMDKLRSPGGTWGGGSGKSQGQEAGHGPGQEKVYLESQKELEWNAIPGTE